MSAPRPGGPPEGSPWDEQAPGPLWSEPGTLLEHVAVAVLGIDEEGRICYWGPGAQRLFGHEAADVLSRPADVLFPAAPLDGPPAAERLAERGRTLGYWRARVPTLHRDGRVFDCGFRVFPVTGGDGRSVILGLASESEGLDRVKTNLAFLGALFETCPIGLVMLDENLRYVHLNQALADMDGIPIEDHIGRTMEEFMITSDGGEYRRMLRAVADEGRPVVSTLVVLRTPGRPDRARAGAAPRPTGRVRAADAASEPRRTLRRPGSGRGDMGGPPGTGTCRCAPPQLLASRSAHANHG